jgi:hypothetical protein
LTLVANNLELIVSTIPHSVIRPIAANGILVGAIEGIEDGGSREGKWH